MIAKCSTTSVVTVSSAGDAPCHVGFGYMRCPYNGLCIPSDFRCDATIDCVDGSDEANCCELQAMLYIKYSLVAKIKYLSEQIQLISYDNFRTDVSTNLLTKLPLMWLEANRLTNLRIIAICHLVYCMTQGVSIIHTVLLTPYNNN